MLDVKQRLEKFPEEGHLMSDMYEVSGNQKRVNDNINDKRLELESIKDDKDAQSKKDIINDDPDTSKEILQERSRKLRNKIFLSQSKIKIGQWQGFQCQDKFDQ